MKIYCFIKDDKIGVYDRPNWKESELYADRTSLIALLGEAETREFIKYVKTKHEPTPNPLLDTFPNTYMYEIEL